jgi:hypothetical protein
MSQNRDAPAYQEYAETLLQLPSSVVTRLQATDARRVRRRPARGYAVRAQNSLVISAPCFLFLILTNRPGYHQKVTTEQNFWNCGTRELTQSYPHIFCWPT